MTNWGALGDLVLSTGVIAEIKATYPNCKIGLAVSSESKVVCSTSPSVDWIHVLKPWALQGRNIGQKILSLLRFTFIEQIRAVKEIKSIGYDTAIELRPFCPNVIPIFWKAKIPLRIGFKTSGNDKLLNAPAEWIGGEYLPHCYWPLLGKIGIESKNTLMPQMILKMDHPRLAKKPYLLFHLCASDAIKEMPIEFWKALYSKCKEMGWNIYFTGRGERELKMIEQVTKIPEEILCNKLSWEQLVQHIKECRGIVSIDSVPIHLAASFGVPTVALFRCTINPILWKPSVPTTKALGIEKPVKMEDVLQEIKAWQ